MHLAPVSIRTILRWAEYAYVATLIFFLTQGPVLSVWFASEKANFQPALAPQLATFLVVQMPALILVSRQKFDRFDLVGPIGLLGLFCACMVASTLWATNSQHTIIESVSLISTFICGVYFAKRFSLVEKLSIIVVAMQPGLLLSRYAIAHDWKMSKSIEGYWVGIYFNRNSLAPVAMVSFVTALTLMYVVYLRKFDKLRIFKICVLADIAIFALVIVIRTRSNTPFGGLLAGSAVFMFWEGIRRTRLASLLHDSRSRIRMYSAFIALVGLVSWFAMQFQSQVLRLFGETVDFNGRSSIWKYSWNGFLERPLLGWGWLSAWRSWAFMKMDLWWTVEGVSWSHNAYLDVLLGGGVLAVVIFVSAVVWGIYRIIPTNLNNPIDAWPVAFAFFFLAMATQESFIIGNHFLWMIFVAMLSSGVTTEKQPDQSSAA